MSPQTPKFDPLEHPRIYVPKHSPGNFWKPFDLSSDLEHPQRSPQISEPLETIPKPLKPPKTVPKSSRTEAAVSGREQYLDGPEVDVDLLLSGGEPAFGAISDNWPCIEP